MEQTYTKKTQKNRCQRWHSAVSCCCYHSPPQATTPCCHHCCHCLIRGSSGEAGVETCDGGSGSSSRDGSGGGSGGSSGGGGSGAILFLLVVVILLLFARPLLVRSFPFLSLAALSAGRCLPAFNAQWLVVVCSCPLPSLSSSSVQRSSMIVLPAAGRQRISLLLCHRRPAPLLLFERGCPRPRPCRRRRHCGQRRGPVGEHDAVAKNQLVLQS